MEKSFCFVNGIANDEETKKVMRRHVMKGKNAGKKIHRRSRLDLQDTRSHPSAPNSSSRIYADQNQNENVNHAEWRYLSPKRLSIELGNVLLTFSLPVQVSPYSLEVINKCKTVKPNSPLDIFNNLKVFLYTSDRIYPVKLGVSLHDAKFMWLRCLFESEASEFADVTRDSIKLLLTVY